MVSDKALELFRLYPSGDINIRTVESGSGLLKTGSYQFAFRLINEITGKHTKYSLFTNPVAISTSDASGSQSGAINTFSNKSILLEVSVTNEETSLYDAIQIAVLENNTGESQLNARTASILRPVAISSTLNRIYYSSNEKVDSIGIEDIVIDGAQIKTFKTLHSKNNKLIGGNVTYKDLSYDSENLPEVTSGQIIERYIPFNGSTDKPQSESRGYFSDEVYRFYAAFWDSYGDFSLPIALDMGAVVGNSVSASVAFKDMKFPKRSSAARFIDVLYRDTENETVVSTNKGLRITISNVPEWAKGVAVLRAKRKKDILFQSPLIPTTIIQSPDAQGDYPGEARTAPSPIGIIAPKNMGFSLNKAVIRKNEGGDFSKVDWEANYTGFDFCKKIHVAFPPEVIFNNSGVPFVDYIKNGNLKIDTIDYCALSEHSNSLFSRNKNLSGLTDFSNDSQRSSSVTSYAGQPYKYASYIYSREEINSRLINAERNVEDIVDSFSVVPSGQSIPVIGLSSDAPTSMFGAYGDLEISPNGGYNGTRPSPQRCAVITTRRDRKDLSYYAVDGSATGYVVANNISAQNADGSPLRINGSTIKPITGENSNPGWEGVTNFIEIVNFKNGLSDERYGAMDAQHELVFTGTSKSFDTAPESVTLDVFGGDCYISPFTFKVQDSHYGVVNSANWGDDEKGWGGISFPDGLNELKRPMSYKSMSYNIGIFLESEVNGLFSEEFLTRGGEEDQIVPSIIPFAGSSTYGSIYSYQGKLYRALKNSGTQDAPETNINVNNDVVSNIGYDFDDLGKSLPSFVYNLRKSSDLFFLNKTYHEAVAPMNYLYNPQYSTENTAKPFSVVYSNRFINRTSFLSRLVYSDTKILQTTLDGFSNFRVGNFYDLEESKGGVTRLVDFSGNIYAVQERGFCYVPFESNILETADGISLAIQSAQIVGIPQYIENFGSQYIRSVQSSPFGVSFFDARNSKIVYFNGSISFLNDLGVSKYIEDVSRSLRALKTSDRHVHGYYDYNRSEVVHKINNEALVHDPLVGAVKTILLPSEDVRWDYGMYSKSRHIVFGEKTNNANFGLPYVLPFELSDEESESEYRDFVMTVINSNSNNKNFLGMPFVSSVKFVVNDKFFYVKNFYLVKFMANKSETASITSYSDSEMKATYLADTESERRAGFLLNKIRDSINGKRVRGQWAEIYTTIENNEIASVYTKNQASYRII